MPYLIYDIKEFDPQEYPLYYCDANVWIAALKLYGIGGEEKYEIPYQNFIEAIINLNEIVDPDVAKMIKNKPKIVLTSLVLSEIINAFMRNVAMKAFFGEDTYQKKKFKRDYRDDPNTDYKLQLRNICSDLDALRSYILLVNDSFETINPFSFLHELPNVKQDFNDLYYYHFLKEKNIPFITHDGDCNFENIKIITANKYLLGLSS